MTASNNSQKTPFARTMNEFAERKVLDAMQVTGRNRLPAHVISKDATGTILTIAFDVISNFTLPQITIPLETSEYGRAPIQAGCKGTVQASDARLGGVSGLGGGTADLSQPANLTSLFFVPLGNAGFSHMDDPNAYLIYGPNGFIIRDSGNNCSIVGDTANITVTAATQILLQVGSASIKITNGRIDLDGTVYINNKEYLLHEHSGVTTGAGNTGGVVP